MNRTPFIAPRVWGSVSRDTWTCCQESGVGPGVKPLTLEFIGDHPTKLSHFHPNISLNMFSNSLNPVIKITFTLDVFSSPGSILMTDSELIIVGFLWDH